MIKQFKGIKWMNNIPYFLLYDINNKKMETKKAEGSIFIKQKKDKRCNGYYDLLKRTYIPCENFYPLEEKDGKQCGECKKLSGFSDCLGCDGKSCITRSRVAKEFCNQPHVVYIALFGDSKFKVGTAAEYRKNSRVLEQGAVASMFIAKTKSGKTARFLEHYISSFGYSLQVSSNYKINNLIISKDSESIFQRLNNEYEKIKSLLPDALRDYLINPRINYYEEVNNINKELLQKDSPQLSLFNEDKKLKNYTYSLNPELICGKIKNIIGTMLIIENQEIYVFDTKKLEGWIIDIECKV